MGNISEVIIPGSMTLKSNQIKEHFIAVILCKGYELFDFDLPVCKKIYNNQMILQK